MNTDFTELTVFAVDCIYGQLISAVYSALAYHGRRTLSDIVRILNLTTRQVKTTLVVLVQHHLVYHITDENDQTYYTANSVQAFNVCFRIAKLAKWAQDRHGKTTSSVLLKLSTLGHAKVEDLEAALGLSSPIHTEVVAAGKKRSFANAMDEEPSTTTQGPNNIEFATNGDNLVANSGVSKGKDATIRSISQLHHIISQLLRDGFLIKVTEHQYLTDHEIAHEAEFEITRMYFPTEGPKGSKEKLDFKNKIQKLKAKWRDAANNLSDLNLQESITKNGVGGRGGSLNQPVPLSEDGFRIRGNYAFRLNFEKASVLLRNSQLVTLAHRYIGETTSKVYEAVLRAQELHLPRCWDTLGDIETRQSNESRIWISTGAILAYLDPNINLKDGLSPTLQSNGVNGHYNTLSSESTRDEEAVEYLQQHLDLLINDSRGFLVRMTNVYSVPFNRLSQTLLQNTIERHVTARFGPIAARIIRMLTQHGTQDEKFLAQTGILKPKEIRALTNILLKAGLIDTQEIPRDGNRTTNRILWLYAFNPKRARLQLLRESHQAMRNLLRRIEAERMAFAFVIRKSERTDVVGREDELLTQNDKMEMATFRAREERMIGMLERLDDFAACLGSEFLPMDDLGTSINQ